MPKLTLTQTFIENAVCEPNKSKVDYFDTKVVGLLLKVLSSGKKSFYLRFKNERGLMVERRLSNIDATVIKLTEARILAQKTLSQVAMGIDPFESKTELKQVPKLEQFIMDSYMPYVKTYKRSWDTDWSLIKNHVLPHFGKLYMDEVAKRDIIQFMSRHQQTHKPGSVNRVIILMRYIFNLAIRWETPGIKNNPTAGIPLLEENNKKERYLTADEANRLILELQQSENSMLQYIVPMLILTGARKQEVLKAKWTDFNFDQRLWRIPTSKSGKARHVPISDGVLLILRSVPKLNDCAYVFPNPKTQLPYISVFCAWNSARKAVGLQDVRMHDLRHSFASFLVNSGRSLYEVQKILGHTQIKTTQRYAHLSNDSLLAAANEVTKAIPLVLQMPVKISDVPLIQVA